MHYQSKRGISIKEAVNSIKLVARAGGRPRKLGSEVCLCCGNMGRRFWVESWTPGYKETTRGQYWHFRHNDGKLAKCRKCGMKDCYVDRLIREQEAKEIPKHPYAELIQDVERQEQSFKFLARMHGRLARSMKSWPLTKDEDKRAVQTLGYAEELGHTIELTNYLAMIELEFMFKGIEMPEKLEGFLKEMHASNPLADNTGSEINLILEPLRRVIKDLDQKYGIPLRKKQKQDKSKKIKKTLEETYNNPKRTLPN